MLIPVAIAATASAAFFGYSVGLARSALRSASDTSGREVAAFFTGLASLGLVILSIRLAYLAALPC